jgi:hypothetical protein
LSAVGAPSYNDVGSTITDAITNAGYMHVFQDAFAQARYTQVYQDAFAQARTNQGNLR